MSNIDDYWATFFGIETQTLKIPGTRVVEHRTLDGYNGAWLFWHASMLIVSVPKHDLAATKENSVKILDHRRAPTLDDATALFGTLVHRIVGPAYQGYVTPHDFKSVTHADVRRLTDSERPSLARFAAVLKPEEWDHASIDAKDEHIFVVTRGAEILAAANAKEEDGATMLGVVTHPGYRGQSIGKAVVSAATSFALSQGRPVRYQTLATNAGSVRIATALGFRDYARTVAVRFLENIAGQKGS